MATRRKIVVDGKTYHWSYHHSGNATVWDGRKRHDIKSIDLTGLTQDLVERGQWKGTSDGMVTPRFIAAWIERVLLRRDVPIPQPPYQPSSLASKEIERFHSFTDTESSKQEIEFPIDFVQPAVYLLIKFFWDDDAGRLFHRVITVTLDPALAKQMAEEKNAARTERDIEQEISFLAKAMKLEYRKSRVKIHATIGE